MDAVNIKNKSEYFNIFQTGEYVLCPECGSIMDKVDQVKEGQRTYTWYECSKIDCDGQWLEKI